mmetsp:Transcript_108940/g.234767  ORF Transcript_108940/g.234767 Transcript_108940/m.234767 type:complete len:322 (+) Transcript_108940:93-1058(+)
MHGGALRLIHFVLPLILLGQGLCLQSPAKAVAAIEARDTVQNSDRNVEMPTLRLGHQSEGAILLEEASTVHGSGASVKQDSTSAKRQEAPQSSDAHDTMPARVGDAYDDTPLRLGGVKPSNARNSTSSLQASSLSVPEVVHSTPSSWHLVQDLVQVTKRVRTGAGHTRSRMLSSLESEGVMSSLVVMGLVFVAVVVLVVLMNAGDDKSERSEPGPPMQFLRSNYQPGDVYPPFQGTGMASQPHSFASFHVPSGPASTSSVQTHMRDPRYTSGSMDPRYTSGMRPSLPPGAPWNSSRASQSPAPWDSRASQGSAMSHMGYQR